MAGEIRLQALTGVANVKAAIYDQNGQVWDGSDMVGVSTLTDAEWTTGLVACTEEQTSDTTGIGLYLGDKPGALADGIYSIVFFSGASPDPGDPYVGTQDDFLEYVGTDIYHADVELTVDGQVPQDRDEYTILWYKNGVWIESGITLPKIQVIKRADGTDLIAQTAMTEVGSEHVFKYDEAANIITYGQAVTIIATATIDGSVRTWPKTLYRDNIS